MDKFNDDVLLMLSVILGDLSNPALASHKFYQPIFILLSDKGANEIQNRLLDVIEEGRTRNEVTVFDFDHLWDDIYVSKAVPYNVLIPKDDIDYFVPLLPMERKYVERCVADELKLDNLQATEWEMK